MLIREVFQFIDSYAPFETQASFDNSGLIIGSPNAEVSGIHIALDVTQRVIDEALSAKANLLLVHHPLMFRPIQSLLDTDYESRLIMRLIQEKISVIAAHTNLDAASGGINDTLANMCGLTDISGSGYLRIGYLPESVPAELFCKQLENALHCTVRMMGQITSGRFISRIAVSSGAGSDSWEEARDLGADAFVSGEIKHHHALAMADSGIVAFECGHFATEEPGIFALEKPLKIFADQLGWNGPISLSKCGGYPFPAGLK